MHNFLLFTEKLIAIVNSALRLSKLLTFNDFIISSWEWKINKGSQGCILCNKEFCEEEEYYSSLFDENDTFIRKDYCTSCWCKDKGAELFSLWKTRLLKTDKPVQKFVNNEVFLDMFIRLEGKTN